MSIIQQHQTTKTTCVSAVAAMLLNKPVNEVVEEFHEPFMRYHIDLDDYLAKNGAKAVRIPERYKMEPGCVYVLLVPALSSIGKFHSIIADLRDPEDPKLYDPSREGRQRYVLHDAEPGETELLSWVIDYQIVHAPAIGLIGEDDGTRTE